MSFAIRIPGRSARLLPAALITNHGSTLPSAPARYILTGTGFSKRPFTRSQRLPVSRPPLQGQRSRPISSMPLQNLSQARSAPDSPTLPGFPSWVGSTSGPVARCLFCSPDLFRISTPLRGSFEPFRLDAFDPVSDREARLPAAPDRLSLPTAVSMKIVSAAAQRSRLATLPEACCSSNLLEPHPSCRQSGLQSSEIVVSARFLVKKHFSHFQWIRAQQVWISCE